MQELECLQKALCEFVSNPDHFNDPNDPEAATVFLSQALVRLRTLQTDNSFSTVEDAQQWLDEITSSRDFLKKYKCPTRVVIRQQDSGQSWPAAWICAHERGTDELVVTFCAGPLHRGAIIFELARVLRAESLRCLAAPHDREFRRVLLALVGAYVHDVQKQMLRSAFKEFELPFTAERSKPSIDPFSGCSIV